MTKYLAVKNYKEHQHYRDRHPVWIKLYNRVMDDEAFIALPDAARGQLILIWLLASRRGNKIPNDAKLIARAIQATTRVNLPALIEAGFLIPWEESLAANQPSSASDALAETEQSARPEREKEREVEAEGETEQNGARPVAQAAEEAFRGQMGEHIDPVLRFLDARPPNARANWFPELLKIIGPATGVLPEDLAGACSDALLVDPPASTPVALRAFATRRKVERLTASIPTPVIRSIGPAVHTAVEDDEAAWSECLAVVGKLRRRQMPSAEFNALPEALRAGLKAIGGWQAVNEAKSGSLPFLRRDFLAAYHASHARIGAA